jgi:protease-4
MTIPPPPPGQGPIDPRGAFSPPPPPMGGQPGGFTQQQMPPPIYPPNPMMMPPAFYPPPPPPRRSFGMGLLGTLASWMFSLSLGLNLILLAMAFGFSSDETFHQTVVVSGDTNQKIAALPIKGVIDDAMASRFAAAIRKLETEGDIKALVLEIDTPGGSVTASDEIYHEILKFKAEKHIPVVVSMGGLATSGGYYVACAADQIIAQRTTITGNIGVLMPRYNFSKLADKYGVEDTTIKSTGSEFKDAGSMFRPERPEEHAYWLGLIDDAYATFKSVVQTGRGNNLKASMPEVANGKAYTSNEALKMGLIDRQGYASDAYGVAASLASLSKMHVVRYEPVQSFLNMFGAESKFIGQSTKNVTVNGVNLSIDRHFLDELSAPRLMYLWRGE